MKTTILLIVIVLAAFFGFLIVNSGSDSNETSQNTQPSNTTSGLSSSSNTNSQTRDFDKVPDFSLEDVRGNVINLSDLKGKTLVINSWATWCPFCVDELPDFAELQKEFADEIIMVAINRQESLEKSKNFTDRLGITENILWLLDPRDSFYKSIGGFSMPETLFVDADLNIIIHKRGPMELSEMISRVNSIIN